MFYQTRERWYIQKLKKFLGRIRFKSTEELGLGEGWAIIGSRAGLEKRDQ